jgi:glucose-1-phosphate thymidylyltransferase
VGDEPFVVHLGDDLLKGGVKKFVKEFTNSDHDGMVLLCKVKEPQRFGVAKFNDNGKLIGLVEKPKQPPSEYALSGIYFFKPIIFKMIDQLKPSWRNELEITEAIQLLLDNGNHVGYQFVEGWWKDTGTIEDILESNRLVLEDLKHEIKGKVEDETSLQGRVCIGENSVVKKGAIIRGPVTIGEKTFLGAHVYVGPYTSIGNNVTITKAEIENSIIMDNCHIDIDGKITDSLIGSYSVIVTNQKEKPKGYRFVLGERSKITV